MKSRSVWKIIFVSLVLSLSAHAQESAPAADNAASAKTSTTAEPATAAAPIDTASSKSEAESKEVDAQKPKVVRIQETVETEPPLVVEEAQRTAKDKTLTLEDSISMAIKSSTTILKAQRDREFGGTLVLQSYLQFLPNLTAQGAYNYNKGKTYLVSSTPTLVNSSSYGPSYTISTTLNLFNGFSDIAAWKAADERRDASEKTLFRAKQQISLDITQSYLQVVLDQKLVKIAEKNLKASKERQTLLEEQTKVGIRNKSDLFRQQAQTSQDEAFFITTQNKLKTDMITFLRKLRISPDEQYLLIEPALEEQVTKLEKNVSKMSEEEMVRQALENRRDYDVARLNAEATSHDVTSVRSAYFPRLDFVGSYLSSARAFDYQYVNGTNMAPASAPSFEDQLRDQGSYYYGLVLTWSLFDHWSNSTNVERAKVTAFKAKIDSEDFRNQVVGEVRQAINDYKSAVQQLEASEKGLIAARKAYDVSEGRYEVGSLNYVDLSVAQTALVQAEATRAQALIGYELQKRAVDYALGTMAVE
ncbi:MAG TPA: TolC family protein [Bdellovibrio sp.]|uniref:TolC family protein n=1 Tax=Bdellovibrio sp. TaxID=28201 RepID=UPI002F10D67C